MEMIYQILPKWVESLHPLREAQIFIAYVFELIASVPIQLQILLLLYYLTLITWEINNGRFKRNRSST